MSDSNFYIGLMSGTSVDGVDAALVEITSSAIVLKSFLTHPMPPGLVKTLIELNTQDQLSLLKLAELENQVAHSFIQATQALLQKANISAEQIQAIGSHGQTIFHDPSLPMSIQIGHPAFIAKQTGITVAADFRIDDMALGGQGAPLAPAFHLRLFQENNAVALLNIGGIANISLLPGKTDAANQEDAPHLIGFDTGPGNGLMDEICLAHFHQPYDKNGEIAASGKVNKELLNACLDHPYFHLPAPKSTGRETFNKHWLDKQLAKLTYKPSAKDLLATLNQLTASSIANQIKAQKQSPQKLLVCGGGAFNQTLMNNLQFALPNIKVLATDCVGVNENAVEAMMCAWLAHQRLNDTPIELSAITGATRNAILGGIWHR